MKCFIVSKKFTQEDGFKKLEQTELVWADNASEALNVYLTLGNGKYYTTHYWRNDDKPIPGHARFIYSRDRPYDTILEITMKENQNVYH